jgi:transcription initiation factor IIE alpha subunit
MSADCRVRLTEEHAMENGVRCPYCGWYNSLSDIVSVGECRGRRFDECEASLALDLVVT